MHMLQDPSNGAFSARFFMDSVSDRVDEGKRKHDEKCIAGRKKRKDGAAPAQKRHANVASVADAARQLVGDVHKILRTTVVNIILLVKKINQKSYKQKTILYLKKE